MHIEAMTASRADDWLAFFDDVAFADNPDWSACYCRVFEFPHDTEDWGEACAKNANRPVMAEAASAGKVSGFLAYDDGAPVGWCRAGERGCYRDGHSALRATNPEQDRTTLSVLCFVVAPGHRRKGVARNLLQAACDDAGVRGFEAVEGYALKQVPIEAGLPAEAELFRGPRQLFDRFGFEVADQTDRYWIMRLALPRA